MSKKIKKILYVTGTRSDFGLMTSVLRAIEKHAQLRLCLYVTGMHLLPEFGKTITEVRSSFKDVKKINVRFYSDATGILRFLDNFFGKLSGILKREQPDIVLTLGDRAEMLAVAMACLYAGIPVAHIHGGEKTSTHDEVARHAITKLAHIHFPATKQSALRIQRMGEEARRIQVVGAPALDTILQHKLYSRKELCSYLKIDPAQKILLLTQHSVSSQWRVAGIQVRKTLQALKRFHFPIIAIYPNSDPGAEQIIKEYSKEKHNPLFHVYPHIEYRMFLTLEREAAVWIGNSSAALIESVSFQTPVVNIGTRQLMRQRGGNVIDVGYNVNAIEHAISQSLYDQVFLKKLRHVTNPWGDGRAGERIANFLAYIEVNNRLLNKQITY